MTKNLCGTAPDESLHIVRIVAQLKQLADKHAAGQPNQVSHSAGDAFEGTLPIEAEAGPEAPPVYADWARQWQAAEKIVYSRTLERPWTARTRLEHSFDPDAVRRLKAEADRDITVAGPGLAAQAIRAGLVDECHFFVVPVVVGGGKRSLPDGIRLDLDLLDERRFGNGTVYLRYRLRS